MCSQFLSGQKYRVRGLWDMIIVLFLIFPADTAYQAREQGQFRRMILPILHPARRSERYGARQICTAAAASTAATAEMV